MKTFHKLISAKRVVRLKMQGFCNMTDAEVSEHAVGNRFATTVCFLVLAIVVPLAYIPLLTAMMIIAFFGVVLTDHPFDYVYNNGVRQLLDKPKLLHSSSLPVQ